MAPQPTPTDSVSATEFKPGSLPYASPSIRKFARELGVDLMQVTGTGSKGRILLEDVQAFVKQSLKQEAPTAEAVNPERTQPSLSPPGSPLPQGVSSPQPPLPQIDFAKFGAIERKPLARIQKISGANLHRNWVSIPHVTNNDEADITDLEALRLVVNQENEKLGIKVTLLAFLMKAIVAGLKKYPAFNASLVGDDLVLKQYYHIGLAVDTPKGLVVPVMRDVDKKGVLEIAQEMITLARKAREGKLSAGEMQGGCFSISSLGSVGGGHFTPIINAPEVAILGLGRAQHKPVWDGKQFVPRLMLPLSLSYDHRVIDGAMAARFNTYLSTLLADFRRIAL
jgi:pyruvate dehydrogenase E2 component (dihydrolipoamide acetyltransferase)